MNDDRLHRWLDAAARPRPPDPDFAAALLEDIGDELGFAGTPRAGQTNAVARRRNARAAHHRRRSLDLLLVAAISVAAVGGLIAGAGAMRDRLAAPPRTSLLTELRRVGHIRVAIRPDHPQFTIGGQAATGFDADVAGDLARRLGVASDLVIEDAAAILRGDAGARWDIALPSVPVWTIDAKAFLASTPYYRWPHLLVVPSASTAAGVDDVGAGPICAVAGDAGDAWLRGTSGDAAASPISSRILTRATDLDCMAMLQSGDAIAAVTAHLSAADLAVLADVRVIGGPPPEPRAVIVPLRRVPEADSDQLLRAVNDAIVAMQADGTLTRLSQKRFGGDDLTAP